MVSMIQYDTTVQQITFTIKHLGIKNTQILILRSSYKTKSNTYKMHLCPFFHFIYSGENENFFKSPNKRC